MAMTNVRRLAMIQGDTIPSGFLKEALRILVTQAFGHVHPSWQFGPLHIIVSDQNVEDGNIAFCRRQVSEALTGKFEQAELDAMGRFLDYLEDI